MFKRTIVLLVAVFFMTLTLFPSSAVCADGDSASSDRIYISHFSGYTGPDSISGKLYGESFFIMPDDRYADEILRRIRKAYACVIEKRKDTYTIVHTAQYEDKSDWCEKWLNTDGGAYRFVFAAYYMNDVYEYPETYNFEMLSFKTVAFGFDPSKVMNGDGEEGALVGKQVYFYNVDFENRAVATEESWGTPRFSSSSYFTVGKPDENPIVAMPQSTVSANDSIAHSIDLEKEISKPDDTKSDDISARSSKVFALLIVLISVAAIVAIVISYRKKREKARRSRFSRRRHHHHHHSSSDSSAALFGQDIARRSHKSDRPDKVPSSASDKPET